MKKVLKIEKMPTAPGIPKRSPIQVLTGPDVAWLPGADETGYVLRGMAVDEEYVILNKFIIILKSVIRWTWISIGHEKNGIMIRSWIAMAGPVVWREMEFPNQGSLCRTVIEVPR